MIDHAREIIAAVLAELGATAAGLWRVDGDQLVQVAFTASEALDDDVAREFAAATRSIPLAQTNLGVVAAVRSGVVVALHAAALPGDSGSGLWLQRFRAARSVSVPLAGRDGRVSAVVAASFATLAPDDQTVADRLRTLARATTTDD
jgi:hypothetical protein